MKDFFISYTYTDKQYATWVAQLLEENGYSVIIQAWDFQAGDNFVVKMDEALKECQRIIPILSEEYLKSKFCMDEWTSMLSQKDVLRERRIIPIKIKPVEIKGLLSPIVHIDIVNKSEEEAKELILSGLSEKERKAEGFPSCIKKQDASKGNGGSENCLESQRAGQKELDSAEIDKLEKLSEFKEKLRALYNKDGMMKCFYHLFANLKIQEYTGNDIKLLSIVQDEYRKLYDQYYLTRKVTDTIGFNQIVDNPKVVEMENSPTTHPLLVTYLQFVKADTMYFIKQYDGAIEYYENLLETIITENRGKHLSDDNEGRCIYLMNSIAWSYRLRDNDGDKQRAIDTYYNLFKKYEKADTYGFSSTYRRNYGVCLERIGKYPEALAQYKKALMNHPDMKNKAILYITYCTVIMKYWDQEAGKITGCWIKRTRQISRDGWEYFDEKIFRTIEARLDFAKQKAPEHLLPNVYNQEVKMLTYKMILAQTLPEKNTYKDKIQKQLIVLKDISGAALGWHYINRDYYYALYELTHNSEEKKKLYQSVWDENEWLKMMDEKGDAVSFGKMLERKQQK